MRCSGWGGPINNLYQSMRGMLVQLCRGRRISSGLAQSGCDSCSCRREVQRSGVIVWRKRPCVPMNVGTRSTGPPPQMRSPVHPRARGEHCCSVGCQSVHGGSSPRTWGTQVAEIDARGKARFIPTHVGNTSAPVPRAATPSVHPHARGEHCWLSAYWRPFSDSSPRTWGTHHDPDTHRDAPRFIPMHVGNTAARLIHRLRGRFIPTHVGEHSANNAEPSALEVPPHARGEHGGMDPMTGSTSGSSPRTWGTRPLSRGLSGPTTVHPHARGEHDWSLCWQSKRRGSSPRTWGTPSVNFRAEQLPRFIPTHVGNTPTPACGKSAKAVHPHARGEHQPNRDRHRLLSGSSPRTWGTRTSSAVMAALTRFIPTHVGNTPRACRSGCDVPVHPHARGEHALSTAIRWSRIGSSPRTWGTLQGCTGTPGQPRFIPTHVGNTQHLRR